MTTTPSSITIIHNMGTKRVTISIPEYLYNNLNEEVPAGQVSSFVAQAVETRLMERSSDPVGDFIKLREKVPKIRREDILKAIRKGRA